MVAFQYRRISQGLIEELTHKIAAGESVVLLGPRYSGKQYLMKRLHVSLNNAGIAPLIPIRLSREDVILSEQEITKLIAQAASTAAAQRHLEGPPGERVTEAGLGLATEKPGWDQARGSLFGPLDRLSMQVSKPLVVFVTNVDDMPHHLARRFLEGIRTRVEARQLVAVLSGEDDFRDLVHGPKSEFNCANKFVSQGFAEEVFRSLLSQYIAAFHLELESPEDTYHELWDLSDGNVHLAKLVLQTATEFHMRSDETLLRPVEASDITCTNLARAGKVVSVSETPIFHYVTQIISREPACLDDLDRLIRDEPVLIGLGEGAPGSLELSGAAVRDGARLRFASPLMAEFIHHSYGDRRFGDLYARSGSWDRAFERYARLEPEQQVRPSDVNDRAEVAAAVDALSAALYLSAAEGIEQVNRLFCQGCRYMLGFGEITFWQRDRGWQLQDSAAPRLSAEICSEIARILPSRGVTSPGPVPLPEDLRRFAVAALLPALRSDRQNAVVISDLGTGHVISREREHLARELLAHFAAAYSHAISVERDRVRLSVRNQHIEIMNAIFDALGSRVLDPRHVFAMAAHGLRNLGYRRVFFCLVDAEGQRVQGVLDDSDDPSVDVAGMTDWPLDQPTADLQPYVIQTCRSRIVEDAGQEPLANKAVVAAAHMTALAIVPILNRASEAIGTIHVERYDGVVPSLEEVEDLEAFGRQLAVAVEQSERVNLLQSALDRIAEPIAIVGLQERLRYANKPAADLLDVRMGWRDRSEAEPLPSEGFHEIVQLLRESLTSGHRLIHHIQSLGRHTEYRGTVLSDSIQDWREHTVGALLHAHDLSYLHRTFEALKLIGKASDVNSAMACILQVTHNLGHRWQRLYVVDTGQPDRLIGKAALGFSDLEAQARFEHGEVILPRGQPDGHAWLCIDERRPLIFSYTQDLENASEFMTRYGLRVRNLNPPDCVNAVKKNPGDFWIDLPLITSERILGKLTLQCNEDLHPEAFDLLAALSDLASGLLDTFLRREEDGELWTREAAQITMAMVAHNIATRMAALPVLLTRYKLRETQYPELKDLNNRFAEIMGEALETVTRAKERLATVVPRPVEYDLAADLEHALRSALPDNTWSFDCCLETRSVQADRHLLRSALLELIQNTRDLCENLETMHIWVFVEPILRGSQEWIRIVYRDNGPGVPTQSKRVIFDDFYSQRPGRKVGTGLGLGFVRRVVTAHGGTVREEGEPLKGAEFVIEIPRFAAIPVVKEKADV